MTIAEIFKQLKEARHAAGLTLRDISNACGIAQSTLSMAESGKRAGMRGHHLVAWAAALGFELTLTPVGPGSTSPECGPTSVTPALPAAVGPEDQLGVLSNLPPLPPKWKGEDYLSRHPEGFPDGPCERCRNRASIGRCCSSHNKELCHRCYRVTHFVEVCSERCERCAAEQLPPNLTNVDHADMVMPAEPTKGGTE